MDVAGHNFSVWIATINGYQYVYYRLGDRKTRYLGPVRKVYELIARLSERGLNKAAIQFTAATGTVFDEAKELVRRLKELFGILKPKQREALIDELDSAIASYIRGEMEEVEQKRKELVAEFVKTVKEGVERMKRGEELDFTAVASAAWLEMTANKGCKSRWKCSEIMRVIWEYLEHRGDFDPKLNSVFRFIEWTASKLAEKLTESDVEMSSELAAHVNKWERIMRQWINYGAHKARTTIGKSIFDEIEPKALSFSVAYDLWNVKYKEDPSFSSVMTRLIEFVKHVEQYAREKDNRYLMDRVVELRRKLTEELIKRAEELQQQ